MKTNTEIKEHSHSWQCNCGAAVPLGWKTIPPRKSVLTKSAQINSNMMDSLTLLLRAFEIQREAIYPCDSSQDEAKQAVAIKRALRNLIQEVA